MKKRHEMQIEQGDPLIPILNLVCMLIPLLLYGAVFVRFKTLDVDPPKINPLPPLSSTPEESLQLRVTVGHDGFYIRVNPRYQKSWMSLDHIGPDIPKGDNGFDFVELHRKLRELKNEHSKEASILIGAEDDIAYEVIIKTMDFTRGTPQNPLFPNVQLTRSVV